MDWNDYDWMSLLEKVALALVIILVTWLLAKVVKMAFTKLVAKVKFFQRSSADGESLGSALGQIASLLVWLLGLVAVLQVFSLEQVLTPIQRMLGTMLAYLPNIIGAIFVFFIGYIIAKIARQLTQTALEAAGFDRGLARLTNGQIGSAPAARPAHASGTTATGAPASGPAASSNSTSMSSVLSNLVFALILIVVSIAALQVLGISAISDPAQSMLQTILDAIPRIIAAAILLGLGWFIAKFAGQLLQTTLQGLGTDRVVADLGVMREGRSFSAILGRVAQVAIILFFAVMATRMLGFPEVTRFIEEVLSLGGRVLFGAAIIAAGVLIASVLRRTVGHSTASTVIYWATIALFAAMGLSYMGIADEIITLAFGAVVVGGAAAAALAFGLGGREAAARTLNKVEQKVDDEPQVPQI